MTTPQPEKRVPILAIAWTRYAQMDAVSSVRTKPHMRLRRWVSVLGVLATLFAILTEIYPETFPALGGYALKVLLILTPLISSVIAAFINRFYATGDWLVTRAGAEEILKEIYFFRTIFKGMPDRREYLEKRLTEIQRNVFRGLNNELVLNITPEKIPPYYDPSNPNKDPGFRDLTGDEYFRFRLEDQLAWHIVRLEKVQKDRVRLQIFILLAGATGAFLAALGGPFSLWVALTASIAASLIGWQELRNLDPTLKNYSKVVMELTVLYDHWQMLEPEERTDAEFFHMVRSTEEVLWSQNVEWIKSMQEALAESTLQEAELINGVLRQAVEADVRLKSALAESVISRTGQSLQEGQDVIVEEYRSAYGTLAEQASSELVQQELAAMRSAVASGGARLKDRLADVAAKFADRKIGKTTPKEELYEVMTNFPPSGDVKG